MTRLTFDVGEPDTVFTQEACDNLIDSPITMTLPDGTRRAATIVAAETVDDGARLRMTIDLDD